MLPILFLFFAISIFSVLYFRYLLISQGASVDAYTLSIRAKNISDIFGIGNRNLVFSGQFWRLISYAFIHRSFWHIFFNLYALIYLGLMIENKLGWKKFLFIYFCSTVCAGLVALIFDQEAYTFGTSSAIMGFYGAFITLLLEKTFERKATQALLMSTLIVVFLVLLNGFLSKGSAIAANVAGFISGLIFCYLLTFKASEEFQLKIWARYAVSAILFFSFFAAVVGFTPKYQTEEFKALNQKFNANLDYLNGITRLKIDLPKDAKLKSIKEDGIIPMEANLKIIKQMDALVLKKEDAKERDRKVKLGKISYRAVMLMYRDIKGDSTYKYSKETSKVLGQVFNIVYDGG